MTFLTLGMILLLVCGIAGIFLITSYILFKGILIDYHQNAQRMTADELFETLSAVINSEINILEKDVFSTFGNTLDSQSYENYYQYLSRKCINDLSESFLYRASYIMNRDAIIEVICKNISNYLKTKLASPQAMEPVGNEDDDE